MIRDFPFFGEMILNQQGASWTNVLLHYDTFNSSRIKEVEYVREFDYANELYCIFMDPEENLFKYFNFCWFRLYVVSSRPISRPNMSLLGRLIAQYAVHMVRKIVKTNTLFNGWR